MTAAVEGVELTTLEVRVTSRSDTRGLLNMPDAEGVAVYAGLHDLRLAVRIAARGVPAQRLKELVEAGCRCSPIPNAVDNASPLALEIEVGDA